MPLLNDDELRAIRERYEHGKIGPPLNDGPFSHSLQREFAVNESWADIPSLLAHAAALEKEVGRLRGAKRPILPPLDYHLVDMLSREALAAYEAYQQDQWSRELDPLTLVEWVAQMVDTSLDLQAEEGGTSDKRE